MPKLSDRQKDHQRLLENLKLIQKNYSVDELIELLDISMGTWFNRMKEPWKYFSYDDFKAISIYCNIELSQLLEGTLQLR